MVGYNRENKIKPKQDFGQYWIKQIEEKKKNVFCTYVHQAYQM